MPPPTNDVVDSDPSLVPPLTDDVVDRVPPPEDEAVADAELEAFAGGLVNFSLLPLHPDHIARHI